MYRPLPEGFTILPSEIEGLGLFTEIDIQPLTLLGVARWHLAQGVIRTGLGAFVNHSTNPNCETLPNLLPNGQGTRVMLRTIRLIKAGEELTSHYTLYNPER